MLNRYQLISIIIKDNYLSEDDRELIASQPDHVLLNVYGKEQFKEIRKGFYV